MAQELITIFYADDDLDDLDFFKEIAHEIDVPVTLFEEGQLLLSALKNPSQKVSMVFIDLNMPVKSGFDVLREIKSNSKTTEIPVIILTTSINPDDIKLSRKLGANLYIRKPASLNALKRAVNYALSIDWKSFVASDTDFIYHA